MSEFCRDCKFVMGGRNALGRMDPLTCRRYPPVPMLMPAPDGGMQIRPVLPGTDENSTCGEFKAKSSIALVGAMN